MSRITEKDIETFNQFKDTFDKVLRDLVSISIKHNFEKVGTFKIDEYYIFENTKTVDVHYSITDKKGIQIKYSSYVCIPFDFIRASCDSIRNNRYEKYLIQQTFKDQLELCFCCGSDVELINNEDSSVCIQCSCGIQTKNFATFEELKEVWNKRVSE